MTDVDLTWQTQGACNGTDPAIFHPTKGQSAIATRKARAICAACPVLEQCRTHGIHHEQHGFWGGLTRRERQKIRGAQGITLTVPGVIDDGPTIDDLDDGTRTNREIAEAIGLTPDAIRQHRHRARKVAA